MNLQRMQKLAGIKLTEGVMAVPGLGESESSIQAAGTIGRDNAYASFDAAQGGLEEKAPPGMEDMVMKLKKEYPGDHSKAFATAWSIYNKKHGKTEESMEEAYTDVCNQSNPVDARDACRMEEDADEEVDEGLGQMPSSRDQNELAKKMQDEKWARHRADAERLAKEYPEQKQPKEKGLTMENNAEFNMDGHMDQQETDITACAIDRFRDLVDSFVEPKKAVEIIHKELESQGCGPADFAEARRAIMSMFSQKDGGYDDGLPARMEESEITPSIQAAVEEFRNSVTEFPYVDPEVAFANLTREMSEEEILLLKSALESEFDLCFDAGDDADNDFDDSMDGDFDSGMASAGHGSDEDYGFFGGEEFEEAYDFNNGYGDTSKTTGYSDYFPTGADSPVVSNTGPSGARQGDNPEQKKMQVSEVHKELVYGYRNYLKETKIKK